MCPGWCPGCVPDANGLPPALSRMSRIKPRVCAYTRARGRTRNARVLLTLLLFVNYSPAKESMIIMGHTPYVPGTTEDRIAQALAANPPAYSPALTYHQHEAPIVVGLQRTRAALAMLRDVLLIIVLAAVIYFGASAMYALGKARDSLNVPAVVPAATAPAGVPEVITEGDGWDGE